MQYFLNNGDKVRCWNPAKRRFCDVKTVLALKNKLNPGGSGTWLTRVPWSDIEKERKSPEVSSGLLVVMQDGSRCTSNQVKPNYNYNTAPEDDE